MNSVPLSLYRSLNYFQWGMKDELIKPILLTIGKLYMAQFPIYDECKTEIAHDPFPSTIYSQLKLMKDKGLGDYKVGGSTALKLASADNKWENDDVDIMIYTSMNTYEYAAQVGLTNLIKSWTKFVDPIDAEREEKFHDKIYQVLTFQHKDFDKKIQLVFLERLGKDSLTNFLDKILDYPAHVLYEVDIDNEGKKKYTFFLPVKMWGNILQKKIPRNLHCLKSTERIEKYKKRGFEFFTEESVSDLVEGIRRIKI